MKKILTSITLLVALLSANQTTAQTYTFNWGSSFASPWAAGSSTTRTTNSIGGSGVTATVSFSSPEATAMSAFGGFSSPQVSSAGFPFNTQLGSNVSNLALGMNLSSKSNYVDVTIAFSATVSNVVFNVADIDKNSNNTNTYFDEILVTGKYGAVAVTNPVLSKLNGTAVNAVTDTAIISGNMAYSNPTNNRGGNTASSSTEQNGTVQVNFGIVPLTSITIRYLNYTGSQNNPADQAIGIGNINFQKSSTLPVVLSSFTAAEKNGAVQLDWTTSQEINAASFAVEKSNDGNNWQVFSIVAAAGNSSVARNYTATDAQPFSVTYYRLKQVDADGAYVYSKMLIMTGKVNNNISVKIFPNPVTSTATITTSSTANKTVYIKVYSNNGMLVKEMTRQIVSGTNNIDIPGVSNLAKGLYTIAMTDNGNNKPASVQFIKQ